MKYLDENYPDIVISWDVLNEAIDDTTNWLRNSSWLDTMSWCSKELPVAV